jgi:ABC-type thiamine transport system ATPase subunit
MTKEMRNEMRELISEIVNLEKENQILKISNEIVNQKLKDDIKQIDHDRMEMSLFTSELVSELKKKIFEVSQKWKHLHYNDVWLDEREVE